MSSQPPYGDYPPQNQPWQGQPPDPSYPGYAQPGAYPPPPSYGDAPYPPPPGQPGTPMYGAPNIYMQPAPYPYVVAAPPDPGAGQAVTSLVLGIISIVFTFIPCFGFIAIVTGIIGLVMGILGRKSVTRHGMAVTGIVLSAISLGLSVLFTILYIGLNILTLTLPSQ
ncbi:MAG TPA: DUF4190 domain-containing protein [Ktedonobacterales bacterium]|nr:DUF4190 domain-containing protein [Ktedonobacterales bacterium]